MQTQPQQWPDMVLFPTLPHQGPAAGSWLAEPPRGQPHGWRAPHCDKSWWSSYLWGKGSLLWLLWSVHGHWRDECWPEDLKTTCTQLHKVSYLPHLAIVMLPGNTLYMDFGPRVSSATWTGLLLIPSLLCVSLPRAGHRDPRGSRAHALECLFLTQCLSLFLSFPSFAKLLLAPGSWYGRNAMILYYLYILA